MLGIICTSINKRIAATTAAPSHTNYLGSTALGTRGNKRGEARGAHRGGTRRPGGGLGAAGRPDLKQRRRNPRWKKGSVAGSRCSSARLRSGSSTYPTETT